MTEFDDATANDALVSCIAENETFRLVQYDDGAYEWRATVAGRELGAKLAGHVRGEVLASWLGRALVTLQTGDVD